MARASLHALGIPKRLENPRRDELLPLLRPRQESTGTHPQPPEAASRPRRPDRLQKRHKKAPHEAGLPGVPEEVSEFMR